MLIIELPIVIVCCPISCRHMFFLVCIFLYFFFEPHQITYHSIFTCPIKVFYDKFASALTTYRSNIPRVEGDWAYTMAPSTFWVQCSLPLSMWHKCLWRGKFVGIHQLIKESCVVVGVPFSIFWVIIMTWFVHYMAYRKGVWRWSGMFQLLFWNKVAKECTISQRQHGYCLKVKLRVLCCYTNYPN